MLDAGAGRQEAGPLEAGAGCLSDSAWGLPDWGATERGTVGQAASPLAGAATVVGRYWRLEIGEPAAAAGWGLAAWGFGGTEEPTS